MLKDRKSMVKLSVNVNKLATLRNARGENNPDVLKAAKDIESYGAHGITVHPRPDERHIRIADVYAIKKNIQVEFNIEGYPSDDYISLVQNVAPTQATLVPDPPNVLTSDAGWEVEKNKTFLQTVVKQLKKNQTRVSIFIDPYTVRDGELELAKSMGVDRIELYTKAFADAFKEGRQADVVKFYQTTAEKAFRLGLGINAGHDLSLDNLQYFVKSVPYLAEVSIGHALICDALYFGLEETVKKYLKQLQ